MERRGREGVDSQVVSQVSRRASRFVPPAERIAVFDNDGTLWADSDLCPVALWLDRVNLLGRTPRWKDKNRSLPLLKGDLKGGWPGATRADGIMMATHAGTTTEEFERA